MFMETRQSYLEMIRVRNESFTGKRDVNGYSSMLADCVEAAKDIVREMAVEIQRVCKENESLRHTVNHLQKTVNDGHVIVERHAKEIKELTERMDGTK